MNIITSQSPVMKMMRLTFIMVFGAFVSVYLSFFDKRFNDSLIYQVFAIALCLIVAYPVYKMISLTIKISRNKPKKGRAA